MQMSDDLRNLTVLSFVAFLPCLYSGSSVCAQPSPKLDAAAHNLLPGPKLKTSDLVNALRKSNLLDPAYKFGINVEGDQIMVATERKPKSSDNECKIEAVLIGKAIFETAPDNFQRTKVLLFDYANHKCSKVSVKRAEVKLYGAGGLSEKELLSSLELTTTDSADQNAPTVVPGPMQGARIALLARIDRLKARGTNTAPFDKMFQALEDSAKAHDQEAVRSQYDELKRVLDEEYEMVRSAKHGRRKHS
jgi:hypothetical protein